MTWEAARVAYLRFHLTERWNTRGTDDSRAARAV